MTQREQIAFAAGLTGQQQVTQGIGKMVGAFVALERAVRQSATAFASAQGIRFTAAQKTTQQIVQGARAQGAALRQLDAAQRRSAAQQRRRDAEAARLRQLRAQNELDGRLRTNAQLRRLGARSDKEQARRELRAQQLRRRRRQAALREEQQDRNRQAAQLARQRERTERERERDERAFDRRLQRLRNRRRLRQLRDARALQRSLEASWRAHYARLAGIFTAGGAALGRVGGSLGVFGPAFRSSGNEVARTFGNLGKQSGTSFIGNLTRTITRGIATIPKLVGGVLNSIGSAVGVVTKTIGGAFTGLGSLIGAAFGPVGNVVGSALGGVLGGVTSLAGGVIQAFSGMASGVLSIVSGLLNTVGNIVGGVLDGIAAAAGKILSVVTSIVGKAFDTIVGGVTGAFGKIGEVVGTLARTIFNPITLAVGAASIKVTSDIRDRLIDAFALLDDRSEANLGNITRNVLDMAGVIGKSATDISEQSFDVISAGFRDLNADTAEILQRSAELAVSGNASVSAAGRAIVTVLKALQIEGTEAARVSQFLFDVQDRGRVTIQQVADNFGTLVPTILAARAPLEEVGAAFATLTLSGETPAEAATLLQQTLLRLAAPTADARKNLRTLGIELRELTEQEEARLQVLETRIIREEAVLDQLEALGASTDEQAAKVAQLTDQFELLQVVSGRFVGPVEAIRRIKETIDELDVESIAFLDSILSRIRAQKGVAFLVDNFDQLNNILAQIGGDGSKYLTALEESQEKVSVQVSKAVNELKRLGIAIFDAGAAATSGLGFEGIRQLIGSIADRVESAREEIATLGASVRIAFDATFQAIRPVTDLIGNFFSALSDQASNAASVIQGIVPIVVGSVQQASQALANLFGAGTTQQPDIEVPTDLFTAAFDVVKIRARIAFADVRQIIGDAFTSIDSPVASALSGILDRVAQFTRAFTSSVGSAVGGLIDGVISAVSTAVSALIGLVSPAGLIKSIFTGFEGAVDAGSAVGSIGGQIEATLAEVQRSIDSGIARMQLQLGGTLADSILGDLDERIRIASFSVDFLADRLEDARGSVGGPAIFDIEDRARVSATEDLLKESRDELEDLVRVQRELRDLERELAQERAESREAAIQGDTERQAALRASVEELERSLELTREQGQAILDSAIANEQGRVSAAEERRERERGLFNLRAIERTTERTSRLQEELGIETQDQRDALDEVFTLLQDIDDLQLRGLERREAEAEVLDKLVALGQQQLGDAESLFGVLNQIANIPTPGPFVVPGGGPTGQAPVSIPAPTPFDPSQAATEILSAINSNLVGQTTQLSGDLGSLNQSVLQSGFGSSFGESLTPFENAVKSAFQEVGKPKPGVGSAVGFPAFQQGEGFIPFDAIDPLLIKDFFDQAASGAEQLTLSLEEQLQATKALIQFRDTGELPGPQLGLGLGTFPGIQFQGGQAVGVTPEGFQSDAIQELIKGNFAQQAILQTLEQSGLSLHNLEFIKKLLEEQLELQKAQAEAAAPFIEGQQTFAASGSISPSGVASVAKVFAPIAEAQAEIGTISQQISALEQQIAVAKLELEAQEAAGGAQPSAVDVLVGLESQLAQQQASLSEAIGNLAQAQGDAETGLGSSAVQETFGQIQGALDKVASISEAFPSIGQALEEGTLTLSQLFNDLGDTGASKFFKKAEKEGSKEAQALAAAQQQAADQLAGEEASGQQAAEAGEAAQESTAETAQTVQGAFEQIGESFDGIGESSNDLELSMEGLRDTTLEFSELEIEHAARTTTFAETTTDAMASVRDVLQEHNDRLDDLEQQMQEVQAQIQTLAASGGGPTVNISLLPAGLFGGGP